MENSRGFPQRFDEAQFGLGRLGGSLFQLAQHGGHSVASGPEEVLFGGFIATGFLRQFCDDRFADLFRLRIDGGEVGRVAGPLLFDFVHDVLEFVEILDIRRAALGEIEPAEAEQHRCNDTDGTESLRLFEWLQHLGKRERGFAP